ncbi:MAG: hypothetical protein ACLFRD_10915 [Nitriliruptoraceae bacterium]
MDALEITLGLYATVLPFALVGGWIALSLWDLARREDLARPAVVGWSVAVLVVPVVGAAAYLLGAGDLPRWKAVTFVGGGVLGYLLIVALSSVVGGSV